MKYIILTNVITGSGIGGGGVYVRNKIKFLNENNIDVTAFSSMHGNGDKTIFPELKMFEENIIHELRYPPNYFSKRKINKVINKILKIINPQNEEIVVESLHVNQALWGEILAEKCNGKNFVYLIGEITDNKLFSNSMLNYFDFKHKRRELASITEKSLEFLFKGYKKIKENENYYLNAVCINVVEDYDNPIIDNIKKADYNIASIGRLEKPYVPYMIDQVKKFASRYVDKQVQLVLIGSASTEEMEKMIRDKFANVNNVSLLITGNMFPIPKSLFPKMDVFISSAGSAYVSYYEKTPTISIDANDNMPIGIVGYTTKNVLFRQDENAEITIAEFLDKILIGKFCDKMSELYKIKTFDYKVEFQKHMLFIDSSEKSSIYYPIEKIYEKKNAKNILQRIGIIIFGIEKYICFSKKLKGITYYLTYYIYQNKEKKVESRS